MRKLIFISNIQSLHYYFLDMKQVNLQSKSSILKLYPTAGIAERNRVIDL